MNRKNFLKKGALGLSTIVAIPTLVSCKKEENIDPTACVASPTETLGPFPNKTPADLVRENIIGDRSGIPLMIILNIQNINDDCNPLAGAQVDIWHCDAQGNYSQYDGQLDGSFTNANFCRGRQTTDANGNASFISIFPGWYPGRTPHIHLEVLSSAGNSLLVSQVSWDENISNTVYAEDNYNGDADTSNSRDGIVTDGNLADSLTGNVTDGYTLMKNVKVSG